MAAQQGMPSSALRLLEEPLGMGLTDAGDTADAVAAEGAYYLEQVTITEASEDDYEYEEIPDDNFSIPEGEEDLAKAIQMVQEQATDTHILIKGILNSGKITYHNSLMQKQVEIQLCPLDIKVVWKTL
ncbi:PREDICTED: sperm-associated antigen 16 protein-like [Hipposideros armiger]|uniref:Sperm-associated antigen 16 protein-like n=1 Tax=Hipposideros armiger TaxID=186990 RepID=A0A8B7TH69_HIPAR|nr:PREDICTED: sperm-associated antigen 16 protein-like [Hipposideros armiger]